jgi:hypothetical protein
MTLLEILAWRIRPNILFVGSVTAADAALEAISPLFAGPVRQCVLPGPLQLPDVGQAALVLKNVGALDRAQQQELLRWLEEERRVPVVSLATTPLFALVKSGEFDERLYYRLNTVLEHLE